MGEDELVGSEGDIISYRAERMVGPVTADGTLGQIFRTLVLVLCDGKSRFAWSIGGIPPTACH